MTKKQLIILAIVVAVFIAIMVFVKVVPFGASLCGFIGLCIGIYLGYTAKKLPIIGDKK